MAYCEPCMCGATDCPSCGPAQGYRVEFLPGRGYYNPEPEDDDEIEEAVESDEDAEDD